MGLIRDLPPISRWSGAASPLALVALAALLVVIAGACSGGNTEVNAAVVSQGSPSEGAQFYEQECARCHGDSGDRIPISPLFSKPFLDGRGDATLLAVVADGKLTMPGFSTTRDGPFDGDQIRAVVSYLNARAGRASTTLLAAEGKDLYEELCLSCHGAGGDRIPIAPLSAKGYLNSRSDAELQRVIVEGRGEMAGLGPGYNSRDATAILAYLRYRVQALVASSVSAGRDLYIGNCLACHGTSGNRVPKVALASASFLSGLGDGGIISAVHDGTKTGPAFGAANGGSFTVNDTGNVLIYLKSWAGLDATVALSVGGPAASGETLYLANCSACHGETGDRVPGVALKSAGFLERETREVVTRAVQVGEHQAMPASGVEAGGVLSEQQVTSIVNYLFVSSGAEAGAPSGASPGAGTGGSTGGSGGAGEPIFDGLTAREYFDASCSACHQTAQFGDNLTESDDFYFEKLTAGSMSSFAGGLSDAQVDALVAFMRNPDGTPPPSSGGAATPGAGEPVFDGLTAREYFDATCSACHQTAQFGDNLTESDDFYFEKLTAGSMSSFAGGLSDAQVDALVAFMRNPEGTPPPSSGGAATPGAGEPVFDGLTAREYFDASCSACHQTAQFGDNLTENDDFYFEKLSTGSMSGFAGGLSDAQVDALVAFLRNPDGPPPPSDPGSESPPSEPAELLYGEALYGQACAACHGADGRRIKAALIGSRDWLASLSPEGLINRIGQGDPSSGMPSYGELYGGWLTPEQIQSLAEHLGAIAQ